jgi:hypothetical protein
VRGGILLEARPARTKWDAEDRRGAKKVFNGFGIWESLRHENLWS